MGSLSKKEKGDDYNHLPFLCCAFGDIRVFGDNLGFVKFLLAL